MALTQPRPNAVRHAGLVLIDSWSSVTSSLIGHSISTVLFVQRAAPILKMYPVTPVRHAVLSIRSVVRILIDVQASNLIDKSFLCIQHAQSSIVYSTSSPRPKLRSRTAES